MEFEFLDSKEIVLTDVQLRDIFLPGWTALLQKQGIRITNSEIWFEQLRRWMMLQTGQRVEYEGGNFLVRFDTDEEMVEFKLKWL